jgi:hypothetical protein
MRPTKACTVFVEHYGGYGGDHSTPLSVVLYNESLYEHNGFIALLASPDVVNASLRYNARRSRAVIDRQHVLQATPEMLG